MGSHNPPPLGPASPLAHCQVGNAGVNQKSLGRAGSKCWLGKRPVVRGVVMNPVDHPHGGGVGVGSSLLTSECVRSQPGL